MEHFPGEREIQLNTIQCLSFIHENQKYVLLKFIWRRKLLSSFVQLETGGLWRAEFQEIK